jgi:predicted ribosomally synthesized peptide with nif11-like leader
MSQASAFAFVQRLASDQEFATKIMAAPDVASRIRLAATEGYEVSAEDLAAQGKQLGDADLAAIAGAEWCEPLGTWNCFVEVVN